MRSIKLAVMMLSLASAAPALADQFFAVTPSGAAETLFPEDPAPVVGKLSSKCIDSRWTVISSSATELVCEAPMNMGQSILGQALMGNSYSTPPRRFFRFNVAQINGVSRVQASGWMELQMAFGQMKRTDFSGPEFHNGMMNFMMSSGGKLPKGTTFPNHVMVGVQGKNAQLGKYIGLEVTEVAPGSPAAAVGIAPGDVISQVNKRKLKNHDDWLDATAGAAKAPTYQLEVIRAGKPVTMTLTRAFRPAISEEVTGAPIAKSAVPTPSSSVADEVAKLAQLRSDGLLTEAEFQAAKTKLLAN